MPSGALSVWTLIRAVEYKLLGAFESLFSGVRYQHRKSTQGDQVASFLVDDLVAVGQSQKLNAAVARGVLVLNVANTTTGRRHRRGDGTFGTIVPGEIPVVDPAYTVRMGPVANIRIGAEVKILAKAIQKQLDRVGSDMRNQAAQFERHGNDPICVGIVGFNHASSYTSYEGEKAWETDGGKYKHPVQEAGAAERRLLHEIADSFAEVIRLRFVATNRGRFPFRWLNKAATTREYGAALVRLSALFEKRS